MCIVYLSGCRNYDCKIYYSHYIVSLLDTIFESQCYAVYKEYKVVLSHHACYVVNN